jgi:type VII secretion protein EccB
MQNRRDQVQAHAFLVGRLVSGMLRGEPDLPFSPLRRFSVGTIAGVLVGALVLAGCGILGVFMPAGDNAWRQEGVLVAEKETGARLVFIAGVLRPVLNYTSARLILGDKIRVVEASRKSLRDVPRGLPVGIAGAPDSLPDPSRTDGGTWQVCSGLTADVSGASHPYVTLHVGGEQHSRTLPRDQALLVRGPTGKVYLAWNDRRLLVTTPGVLGALGYAAARQYPVGWGWLNAVPPGPDLVGSQPPGGGKAGPTVEAKPSLVGQIFKVDGLALDGADAQYYVMRSDGLSALTPMGAALMMVDPRTKASYPNGPVQAFGLSASALTTAPRSQDSSVNPELPALPPKLAEVGERDAPCVRLAMSADKGPTVQIGIGSRDTGLGGSPTTGGSPMLADRVMVEAGSGLLIRDQPSPGVADGALYLLTDIGVRFPLSDDQVATTLGYGHTAPVSVPGPVLALVPVGPALSPDAALKTVSVAQSGAVPG